MASPINLYVTVCVLVLVGAITAFLAHRRGRNPLPWFVLGVALGVLAIAILYLWPSPQTAQQRQAVAAAPQPQPAPAQPALMEASASLHDEPKDTLWFYLDRNDEQQGPVSVPELERLWRQKDVNTESYVWSQGMNEWALINDLPTLKGYLEP